MVSTELQKGEVYTLKIDQEASTGRYYSVILDDTRLSVKKFRSQLSEPVPDTIDVYVKEMHDGIPLVSQDIRVIIGKTYKEGEQYRFKIRSTQPGSPRSYNLADDNGLLFVLNNAPANLRPGTHVWCTVRRVNKLTVRLKYCGELSAPMNISFKTAREWLEIGGFEEGDDAISLMYDRAAFSEAIDQYYSENSNWIFTAIKTFVESIPIWLEKEGSRWEGHADDADNSELMRRNARLILGVNNICRYIIENSGYLRGCNQAQRTEYRAIIESHMEKLQQYAESVTSIADGSHIEFIDTILRNLREAGYMYHPYEQFRKMMIILRLCPWLIVERMGGLFEILSKWDRDNWESEPFRSALVNQLEIFIQQLSEHLDMMASNDSELDNKTLMRMVLAIATQSLLVHDEDAADIGLNRAKLYRYISCIVPAASDRLLAKSVASVLGAVYPGDISWSDTTANPALLIHKATTETRRNTSQMVPEKQFRANNVVVRLRDDSISVLDMEANPDSRVLPNGCVPWMNAHVAVAGSISTPGRSKLKDLRELRKMWGDIERNLFDNKIAEVSARVQRRGPEHFEEVPIIIDDADIYVSKNTGNKSLRFHCVIADNPNGIEGEGWMDASINTFLPWLSAKDVDYGLYDLSLNFARDDNGDPLVFYATALINDGNLSFSMRKQLNDYFTDVEKPAVCRAFVTHVDPRQEYMLAVSEFGYTFQIKNDEMTATLCPGSLIEVEYQSRNTNSSLCTMFGSLVGVLPDERLSKKNVLETMFHIIGSQQESDNSSSDADTVFEIDEMMTAEELRELALMFQRKAWLEREFHLAFNYLGFAHLLAHCAGDTPMQEEIHTHQGLMMQLEYFAINRRIDRDRLVELKDSVAGIPMFERLYDRLSILSVIGRPEENSLLWETVNEGTEADANLASLVVSYNLLPEHGLESARKEILDRIADLFNANRSVDDLKYYGQEGPHVEFKSSTVYTNRKSDHMHPNPEEQIRELKEIICGMLNTEGGTLYIGVNDAGYEAGVENDLSYYSRTKPRNFNLKQGVATIDSLEVYLNSVFREQLPEFFRNGGQIAVDPESKRGVIVMTVRPSLAPVYLDGTLFVRQGSSTFFCSGDDLAAFLENRSRLYNQYELEKAKQSSVAEENVDGVDSEDVVEAAPAAAPAAVKTVFETAPASDELPPLATGELRNNVVDSWDEDYLESEFVIHFLGANRWKYSSRDTYMAEDTRLRLAVHHDEVDKMLVLCDEGGRYATIMLSRICESDPDEEFTVRGLASLRFVGIASPGDSVLTVIRNQSGTYYYRVTAVSELPRINKFDLMEEDGRPLIDIQHNVVLSEILSPDRLEEYSKGIIPRRDLYGVTLHADLNDTPEDVYRKFITQLRRDRSL